jgi:alkanesulfonate monooxygenase SsuD/methylene tetrahydromethanopterin reductase-like flavin-dependent oxidoreductase (luciferase family)
MERAWIGEPVTGHGQAIGPPPADGKRVTVMIGGGTDDAIRRTVRYADGWTAGGAPPDRIAPMVTRVREAWREAGRDREPRIASLVYFGLSDPETSRNSLRQYYAFLGEWGERIAESAVRSPEAAAMWPRRSSASASPTWSSTPPCPTSTRWIGSPTPSSGSPAVLR